VVGYIREEIRTEHVQEVVKLYNQLMNLPAEL